MSEGYILTGKQRREIYRRLRRSSFAGLSPQGEPRVVVVAGQQGSGKSTQIAEAVDGFKSCGGVVIGEMDRLRAWCPFYRDLLADPVTRKHALAITRPSAVYWLRSLIQDTMEHRYNMLIHTGLSDLQSIWFLGLAKEFHYQTEFHVLAVNRLTSRLRIYQRYEQQMAVARIGRLTSLEEHNKAYFQMSIILREIEGSPLIDRFKVLNGAGDVLYDSARDAHGETGAVLQEERDRPWTEAERMEHVVAWDALLESMANRLASKKEIESVKHLACADALRLLPEHEGVSRFPELAEHYHALATQKFQRTGQPRSIRDAISPEIRRESLALLIERDQRFTGILRSKSHRLAN